MSVLSKRNDKASHTFREDKNQLPFMVCRNKKKPKKQQHKNKNKNKNPIV